MSLSETLLEACGEEDKSRFQPVNVIVRLKLFHMIIFSLLFFFSSAGELATTTPHTIRVLDQTVIPADSTTEKNVIQPKANDNSNFFVDWYNRNEAVIWTFIFSATIALGIVFLSQYLINKREKKKRQNLYSSLLFSVYADFVSHEIVSNFFEKELKEILRLAKETGKLVSYSALSKISTEFIDKCRIKILDYEDFNSELLAILSGYISSITSLNQTLDINQLSDLREVAKTDSDYFLGVQAYIEAALGHLEKLANGRRRLQEMIISEIERFPENAFYHDKIEDLIKPKKSDFYKAS